MGQHSKVLLRLSDEDSDQLDELKQALGQSAASKAITRAIRDYARMKGELENAERRIRQQNQLLQRVRSSFKAYHNAQTNFQEVLADL